MTVNQMQLHRERVAGNEVLAWVMKMVKLDQHSVARGFDDPAMMFGDLRVYERAPMAFEPLVRSLLIGAHQA
jgi:hypothetical protein